MTSPTVVHVRTLRVEGLDETAVTPWLGMLDEEERQRAARFVMARHRVLFVAAHALLRATLSRFGGPPVNSWRFVADHHGKPAAYLGALPAALSFNLSHTDGMAGVAVVTRGGVDLGFDLEPVARKVELAVAARFFTREEVAWLNSLSTPRRPRGFLQLWTLKEAFIKATGKGLTQNLATFWFEVCPPRIHFSPHLGEDENDWWFEQHGLDEGFIAALGLRRAAGEEIATQWTSVSAADISAIAAAHW